MGCRATILVLAGLALALGGRAGPRPSEPVAGEAQEDVVRRAGEGPGEQAGGVRVPREADAEQQLARARRAKRALWGTTGRARWRARLRALEAYRAVRAHFPEDRQRGAEAAFRAGELWRSGGEDGAAIEEFTIAIELAPTGPFAPRAALEIGHLQRRAGDREAALAAYTAVFGDEHAAHRYRAQAALCAGSVHREQGARSLARALWEPVAHGAEDPSLRVSAFDLLALDLIAVGDLEGAAGTLAQCRAALAEDAREDTARGARVRSALMRMRAIDALAQAVQQRRESVQIDGREARDT